MVRQVEHHSVVIDPVKSDNTAAYLILLFNVQSPCFKYGSAINYASSFLHANNNNSTATSALRLTDGF